MKKIIVILCAAITVIAILSLTTITVHAETKEEAWLRKQREYQEKYMDDLEADGNLTQEAIDSISKGTSDRKPNHKPTNSDTTSGTSSDGSGKGWVYSTDELHVVGLPEGDNGYTKPGYYGDVD